MSEVTDMLNNHIYPNLDRRATLSNLEPKDKGDNYELICPKCREREAYIYKNGTKIICNRKKNCGYEENLWDYIQTSHGLSNGETLKELAKFANYNLPQGQIDYKKLEESKRKQNLLETANRFFQKALFSHEGQETLRYLTESRGYTEAEIRELDFGYNPGHKETEAFIKSQGVSQNEIKDKFPWANSRDEHKLTFPFRNESGKIITIIGRLTRALNEGEKQNKKYLNLSHYERTCFFNSDKVKSWKEIILVEGYLDALTATAKGIENVLATCSASLENKQLESLINRKVKHISLCLDIDEAGQKGTERAIDKLTEHGIKVYVIRLPQGIKDPDELIRKHGAGAFKEAVKNAQKWEKWKAERQLKRHDLNTDKGKEKLIEEALEFDSNLDRGRARDGEDYLKTIAQGIGCDIGSLIAERTTIEERKAREQERKAIEIFHQQGAELIRQGKLIEAREHLQQVTELKGKALRENITPYTYETILEEAGQTQIGLKTGYEKMDEVITIPNEAITIIAGRTSHGKTTFMMNLLLNMLELYPKNSFFFFSYEETRQQVGFKLINILSRDIINENRNLENVRNYCLYGHENRKKIEAGKAKFREYTESGRLWIIEENYRAEDLVNVLSYLKEHHEVGAVFIDYIQKIKAKGKFGTRQLELQEVSSQILEAAKSLSIPIILGAQLGRDKGASNKVKLDNLREAGDIEQDANLVLGIYNEAMENAKEKETPLTDRIVNLAISILKNRNGSVNDKFDFEFDRPVLTMREKPGEQKESKW